MIDSGGKSSAQLLSWTHPEQRHASSKDIFPVPSLPLSPSSAARRAHFFSRSAVLFLCPPPLPPPPRSFSFPAIIIALKMKKMGLAAFFLSCVIKFPSLHTPRALSPCVFFFIVATYVNVAYRAAYFCSQVLLFLSRRLLRLCLLPLMPSAVSDMLPPWARFYKAEPAEGKQRKNNTAVRLAAAIIL